MPHSTVGSEPTGPASPGVRVIDPRAPRFGQTITMSVLLIGIGLQEPPVILAIAVILNVAVLSGWQFSFYGLLWRYGMVPLVGDPQNTEPASPHRFATLMGRR